ncbi:MAG: glycosyltransferase family 39 protein, partial [Planctomycetota bacterium]
MNASRRTLVAALGLFALALGLRAYVASGTIIAKDAYDLTALAKAIDRDGWSAVSTQPPDAVTLHHPMQPAAIALVHRIVPDWMVAAKIASVGFGALAVLAMFGFFCRILPPDQALVAGALAAVHYNLVRFSCDGRSEGAFLFFVAAALWAAANAFRLCPPGEEAPARAKGLDAIWAVLSGLFCAGAYWTRPEGIGVAILIAIWAIADRLLRKEEPGLLRVALGGIVLAACVAAALPYIVKIGGVTQKRDLAHFLTASGAPPAKRPVAAKPPPTPPTHPPPHPPP